MILSVYDHFALQAGGQVKPSIRRQQKNCNNNINRLLLNLDEERVNILEFLTSAGNLFDFPLQLEDNIINLDAYHIPMDEASAVFNNLLYVEIIREEQGEDYFIFPILDDNRNVPQGEAVPAIQGPLPIQPAPAIEAVPAIQGPLPIQPAPAIEAATAR